MSELTMQRRPNLAPRCVLGFGRSQLQPLTAAMLALHDARGESDRALGQARIAEHTEVSACA